MQQALKHICGERSECGFLDCCFEIERTLILLHILCHRYLIAYFFSAQNLNGILLCERQMRRHLFLCFLAVLQIAQVTANTAVNDLTFSIAITDRVAGKISCSATISFATSAGGALNASSTPADKITLSYPAGFFASSATPTASISGISIIASSGAATSTSIVLTLASFSYISSNTAVTITLSGLTMGAATAASREGIF